MKTTDGESSRSGGQPCPPLLKLKGSGNKSAGNGGELQDFQTALTKLAAAIHALQQWAKAMPAGARLAHATAAARAGLRVLGVVFLVAGVGYGLADGDLFDNVGPNCAQQPSRPVHGAGARQAGEQPGGKSPGSAGGVGGGSDGGTPAAQPECLARAKMCLFRLTDGRCEATGELCRLRPMVLADGLKRPTPRVLHTLGNLEYLTGFADVWFNHQHYDLREHKKARLCLEFMVIHHAVDEASARHFLDEIDPYVRETGGFIQLAEIRIYDYFREPSGELAELRQWLIRSAGKNGKFYLNTGAV